MVRIGGEPLECFRDGRNLGFALLFVTNTGDGSSRILGA
jgi:hypothetical protein